MNQQSPGVEWYVAGDHAEWERWSASDTATVKQEQRATAWLRRGIATALVLGLGLAIAGAPPGVDPVTAARPAATPQLVGQRDAPAGAAGLDSLRAAIMADKPGVPFDQRARVMMLEGDRAVVSVLTDAVAGAPPIPQTRFYRRTGASWQQTAPDVTLWGPERSLETPSLIFHFRQRDATAAITTAAQMELLYTTIRQNFGLPSATAGKPVIEVSVLQPPGQPLPWFSIPDPIRVPSPALSWAPAELTEADLLAQSIALQLLEQSLVQTRQAYQVRSGWKPLLDGMRLWQVWAFDLPLAAWREEVVQWLYLDLLFALPERPAVLPEPYEDFCAGHRLWLQSPLQLYIPLICAKRRWDEQIWRHWHVSYPPAWLYQLTTPAATESYDEIRSAVPQANRPGQEVALATLVEYAVTTYGHECLPTLLAGLGHYDTWETLVPAVYGVSPAEFEAGWQRYLVAQYGVPAQWLRLEVDDRFQ